MHVVTFVAIAVLALWFRNPITWAALLVVILVHEAGHALLVRRFRLAVLSIDVTPLGGVCRYAGQATPVQESIIAWGGVLAQAALFAAVTALVALHRFDPTSAWADAVPILLSANLVLMVLNILPFPRLDGWKAWQLFRWRNLRSIGKRSILRARESSLRKELERIDREKRESDQSDHWLN
jgi:Zn-dependent protease